MKKNIFFIIVIILLTIYFVPKTLRAKTTLITTVKEGSVTEINMMIKDKDNFIVVGKTERDAFISKYDLDFKRIWSKKQEGYPMTNFFDVTAIGNGDYVTIGEVWKNQGLDGIISYYDKDGYLLWSSKIDDMFLSKITVDKDYLYIVGAQETNNIKYIKVIKYTLNGNRIWTKEFSGKTRIDAKNILIDNDEVIIVGDEYGIEDGMKTSSFIVKYDIYGRKIFDVRTDEEKAIMYRGIVATSDGYLIAGTETDKDYKKFKGILVKYDKSGKKLWSKYTSSGKDPSFFNSSIREDKDGYTLIEYNALSNRNRNFLEKLRSAFGNETIEYDIYTIKINTKEEITNIKKGKTINGGMLAVGDIDEIYSLETVSTGKEAYVNIYLFKHNNLGFIKASAIILIAITCIGFVLLNRKKKIK